MDYCGWSSCRKRATIFFWLDYRVEIDSKIHGLEFFGSSDYLPTCIIDDIFYSVWCAHAIDWNKYFCWLWRQWKLQHCKQGHCLDSGEITVDSQITFIHIIFSIMEKTQTEFIFKGRDMTSRQFQKSSVGSILVWWFPYRAIRKNVSKRETNEAKEWIQIKKKSFHPSFVWCHFVWSQG